ncbi:MAG: hypothetical protein ACI4QT_01375, partial [Kiritimatiellia bacterium]
RSWIPFLFAVFLSDPALCLTTMFYAEPLACVFLLCGWNLLEANQSRHGWLALGMAVWVKNEFLIFLPLIWFVRRFLLKDNECRFEYAATGLMPFIAWFAVSRLLGAELYDYAPLWAPNPMRIIEALTEIVRLAFGEPWRYGWAWIACIAAPCIFAFLCFHKKKKFSVTSRHISAACVILVISPLFFSFILGLSLASDFRWHCRCLYRLLFSPELLAIRIVFGIQKTRLLEDCIGIEFSTEKKQCRTQK